MTFLKNLTGIVKKQACFFLEKCLKSVPVGQNFLPRGEENRKNSCFEKGFRDWKIPEMAIIEVPKCVPQPTEIAKVAFPWVK